MRKLKFKIASFLIAISMLIIPVNVFAENPVIKDESKVNISMETKDPAIKDESSGNTSTETKDPVIKDESSSNTSMETKNPVITDESSSNTSMETKDPVITNESIGNTSMEMENPIITDESIVNTSMETKEKPVTLTVGLPTQLSFVINPTKEPLVTAEPSTLENRSEVAIDVEFYGFSAKDSNNTKVVEKERFYDKSTDNWQTISNDDTKKNIALGLNVNESIEIWSNAEENNDFDKPLHTINCNINEEIQLTPLVKTGRAWTEAYPELLYELKLRIKASSQDQETPAGFFDFDDSTGTINILGFKKGVDLSALNRKLVIPSRINEKPVTSIGMQAFVNCSELLTVIIPSSVTLMGSAAFAGCDNLANLTIGSSVETIGNDAFGACAINTVTIPSSVTSMGENVFNECRNLSEIIIDKNEADLDGAPWGAPQGLPIVKWKR